MNLPIIKVSALFTVLFLLLSSGCQTNSTAVNDSKTKGVEVVIKGDAKFPIEMQGKWQADRGGWTLVFEPDGKISSAVISMGRFTVKPGIVNKYQLKQDGKGIIKPGLWTVQYEPETQDLVVEINIEEFYMEKAGEIVKGKSNDIFIGKASSDGITWTAEWLSTPEYAITTSSKKYEDHKLPFDEDNVSRGMLTFTKIDTSSK